MKNRTKHLFCLAATLVLTALVAHEKWGDCHSILQQECQIASQNVLVIVQNDNADLLAEIEKTTKDYPSQRADEFGRRAQVVATMTDSLLLLLDGLQHGQPKRRLVEAAQGQWSRHRSELWQLIDSVDSMDILLLDFAATDWLLASFEHDLPEQFLSVVGLAKVKTVLSAAACFNYFASQVSYCGWIEEFKTVVSPDQLAPAAGEAVSGDVVLTTYSPVFLRYKILLDGSELPMQRGVAAVKMRLETAGVVPIRLSVLAENVVSDSVDTWEKTYFLNVRE